MRAFSLGLVGALGATLSAALPSEVANFLLVTYNSTSTPPATADQSVVSATSLFDPNYQEPYILRLIAPGYNSLPRFNITSGTLQSWTNGPHGVGTYLYNSSAIANNQTAQQLQFLPHEEPAASFTISTDGLLTVGGVKKGWTVCDGPLSQTVLWWKGSDASCKSTFVHAVSTAPY